MFFFCKNDPYLNSILNNSGPKNSESAYFWPFGSNPFLQIANVVIQVVAVFFATSAGDFQRFSSHLVCIYGPIGH